MNYRLVLVAAFCLAGCDNASLAQEDPEPDGVSLIEPDAPAAPAGESDLWAWRYSARSDLDGDGVTERVVVLANVEYTDEHGYIWGHGHTWEVHVEEPDGERTRLYGRVGWNGQVRATVVESKEGKPAVLIVERGPFALTAYEVRYDSPGVVAAEEVFARPVEALLVPDPRMQR